MARNTAKLSDMPARFTPGYLAGLDGRTAVAVEMRARWQEITDDLGGETSLSYARRSLVERAFGWNTGLPRRSGCLHPGARRMWAA